MSSGMTLLLGGLLSPLHNERGANQLDYGLLLGICVLIGAIYFYLSGNSPTTFWHDLAVLAGVFRF